MNYSLDGSSIDLQVLSSVPKTFSIFGLFFFFFLYTLSVITTEIPNCIFSTGAENITLVLLMMDLYF